MQEEGKSEDATKALQSNDVEVLREELKRREEEVQRLQEELARQIKEREAERAGRTRAERELRKVLAQGTAESTSGIQPIGYLRSCFPTRHGTPRQGLLAPSTRAQIHFEGKVNAINSLDGLDQFSHVWIIFIFHENTNLSRNINQSVKAKIRPPRLNGAKVGLFSTRTPHRPNPIGLSIAKIDKVSKGILYLSGVDLIDGTPVLDIKPYLPRYDSIVHATCPEWIDDDENSRPAQQVEFSNEAEEMLKDIAAHTELTYYNPSTELPLLKQALIEVLDPDIRSVYQRKVGSTDKKKKKNKDKEQEKEKEEEKEKEKETKEGEKEEKELTLYTLLFDKLEVKFCFPSEGTIKVVSIKAL